MILTEDDRRVEEGNADGDNSMGVKSREWLLAGKWLRKTELKGFEDESCHLVAHELPVGFIVLCGSLNGGCVDVEGGHHCSQRIERFTGILSSLVLLRRIDFTDIGKPQGAI